MSCHLVTEPHINKTVDGKTPYEAAFGKKPDLWQVWEWGDKVWVCVKGGNKLGGWVKEGHWLGVDEQSKGFQVYWPDKRTVSTERNVYHNKTCALVYRLKGEDWEFVKTTTDLPKSSTPINPTPTQPTATQAISFPMPQVQAHLTTRSFTKKSLSLQNTLGNQVSMFATLLKATVPHQHIHQTLLFSQEYSYLLLLKKPRIWCLRGRDWWTR
jgi:hypothetical protein